MRDYSNLVEALQDLKKEGYVHDFNTLNDCLHCVNLDENFMPDTFEVKEVIHFEGDDSSPDSRSILYLIHTNTGEKGVLLSTNNMYNDLSPALLDKLQIKN